MTRHGTMTVVSVYQLVRSQNNEFLTTTRGKVVSIPGRRTLVFALALAVIGAFVFLTSKVGGAADAWSVLGPEEAGTVSAIAISPNFTVDKTIFAGSDSGVFKSTDSGISWQLLTNGLPPGVGPLNKKGIALSPQFAMDQTAFVGIPGFGVFRTLNAGASWQLLSTPIAADPQHGVVFIMIQVSPSYTSDHTLFSIGNVFARSTDGGDSWQILNVGIPSLPDPFITSFNSFSLALSPDYGQDQTVLVGGIVPAWCQASCPESNPSYAAVLKSTNGGDTWSVHDLHASAGVNAEVSAIAVSPDFAIDQTLFVGTADPNNNLLKSTDGGASWEESHSGISDDVQDIAISPDFVIDSVVYLGTGGGGALRSIDGGATWQNLTNNCGVVWELVLSPNYRSDHTIFAGLGSTCKVGSYTITGPVASVPSGTDILVDLGNAASLTFSSVLSAGTITVTTSTTPPVAQSGFVVNGVYYDIATTANFSGAITVTLPYDPVTITDPSSLRLFHFDQALGSWVDVTTAVETNEHTVTGVVGSLSPFAIGVFTHHFVGFLEPVNANGTSIFKLKSTVPVKFQLKDLTGAFIGNAIARIFIAKVSNGVAGSEQEAVSTNAPDSGNLFRYDSAGAQYIFNLGTKNLSKGTWQIRVGLDNGVSHTVLISLN